MKNRKGRPLQDHLSREQLRFYISIRSCQYVKKAGATTVNHSSSAKHEQWRGVAEDNGGGLIALAILSQGGAGSFMSTRNLCDGEMSAGDTWKRNVNVPGPPLGL